MSDFSAMAKIWENNIKDFLVKSADIVTIHYKPVRTGVDNDFDSFFQEGMDSSNPSNIGSVVSAEPPTKEVSGKVHLDLYGSSISQSDSNENISIGSFPQADAMFTCLLSDAIIDDDKTKTIFDEADYVIIEKSGLKYVVKSAKPRGLGDAYVLDVFMDFTNK